MRPLSRREFLATLAAGSLAGCLGPAGQGPGETDTDERNARRDGDGTSTGTVTQSGLTLDTLAVGGSPGGPVPVRPAQVTLLDFFGTWCAPCKPQMEHLRAVNDRFPDVHMLSITWERDAATVESFWREYDGTWPVARDPDLRTGERYGVTRIPTLLVFDAAGEEVWRHVGLAAADSIADHVETAQGRA